MILNLNRRKAKQYLIFFRDSNNASMSEEELSTPREKNRLKLQVLRAKNKAKEVLNMIPVAKNGFKTPQGFGKAMKRLKSQLPKSLSKKLATVKDLVNEMGLVKHRKQSS